ncbi:MAG: hypothetical protein HY754_13115 [Nitrospirae bacterium]|nr:hypothetical protein [Nitrospirota bacterium]
MKILYKYKCLDPFERIADILCNNSFYTALFSELNDPMEGILDFLPGTKPRYIEEIKETMKLPAAETAGYQKNKSYFVIPACRESF